MKSWHVRKRDSIVQKAIVLWKNVIGNYEVVDTDYLICSQSMNCYFQNTACNSLYTHTHRNIYRNNQQNQMIHLQTHTHLHSNNSNDWLIMIVSRSLCLSSSSGDEEEHCSYCYKANNPFSNNKNQLGITLLSLSLLFLLLFLCKNINELQGRRTPTK